MCKDVHMYRSQHTGICGPVSPLRHLDCPSWSSVLRRPCLSSVAQAAEKPWSRRQHWVGIITDADTANAWRGPRASVRTPCPTKSHHSPSEVTWSLAVPSAAVKPVLQKTLLLLNRSPLGGPDPRLICCSACGSCTRTPTAKARRALLPPPSYTWDIPFRWLRVPQPFLPAECTAPSLNPPECAQSPHSLGLKPQWLWLIQLASVGSGEWLGYCVP